MADYYTTLGQNITNLIVASLSSGAGDNLSAATQAALPAIITAYMNANSLTPLTLSTVNPDFEAIITQFVGELSKVGTWTNTYTASTGQTLSRFVAAACALNMDAIIRALHEDFRDTARLTSSQLVGARSLGVHIQRKSPATAPVTFTNSNVGLTYVLSPLSQLNINGNPYFNRDQIVFNTGVSTLSDFLYQGQLNTITLTGDGTPLQRYLVGNPDFTTSDTDVYVTVDGTTFIPFEDGPWNYAANANVYFTNGNSDGSVEIIFGNGIYGAIPALNSTILVTFAVCNGDVSNNSTSGLTVTLPAGYSTITGVTTGAIYNGAPEKDKSFYAVLSPYIYESKGSAINRDTWKATALTYPGVVDAIFLGQADINPSNVTYMNVVQATILTTSSWNSAAWNAFAAFMDTKMIFRVILQRADPTAVPITITINVYCFSNATLTSVQSQVINNINTLMTPRLGSLGRLVAASDIDSAVKKSGSQVSGVIGNLIDYYDVSPTSDTAITSLQYASLGTLTVNTYYTTRPRNQ